MAWLGIAVEAVSATLGEHPDVAVLMLIAAGGYYELHHGTVADMAEKQYTLATAVYLLLATNDDLDEDEFRDDMWNGDDARPYPGDYEDDTRPAEPSVRND